MSLAKEMQEEASRQKRRADDAEFIRHILNAYPGENKRFTFDSRPDGTERVSVEFDLNEGRRYVSYTFREWERPRFVRELIDRGRIESLAQGEVLEMRRQDFARI